MAVRDPKAIRSAINYTKGRVVGARGLLEYLFTVSPNPDRPVIVRDKRGRRRVSGMLNRTLAVGGKQLVIETKEGDEYQLHYSGAMVDWIQGGLPLLDRSVVNSWSTIRGKKRYL